MICRNGVHDHMLAEFVAVESVITCAWYSGTKLPCLLPKKRVHIDQPSQFKQYCGKLINYGGNKTTLEVLFRHGANFSSGCNT